MARLDRAGEEGDLATWRAIPTKVCHGLVRSTLKIGPILPNPDVFSMNRRTIARRNRLLFFVSVGEIPILAWMRVTETAMWSLDDSVSINDAQISFSFGQVCF